MFNLDLAVHQARRLRKIIDSGAILDIAKLMGIIDLYRNILNKIYLVESVINQSNLSLTTRNLSKNTSILQV